MTEQESVSLSAMPDRRVVVITGAGASVNLGVEDRPIPMMSSWATSLVEELGPRAQQVGIQHDMPGDIFEANLGRFLAFAKVLDLMERFAYMGTLGEPQLGVDTNFSRWMATAREGVATIERGLWTNLFECYSSRRIDDDAAGESYRALHKLIRSADDERPESYIWHVTTNYDTAIETALETMDRVEVVTGFPRSRGGRAEIYDPMLLTASLNDSTNRIPVVHLHGAVGWYYDQQNRITRQASDRPYDDRQRAALLLPDDAKDPASFDEPTAATWRQFEHLLHQATHVLILGHSLHDAHLVRALRGLGARVAAVAHTRPDDQGTYPAIGESDANEYQRLLPGITLLAGAFGQRASWPDVDPSPLRRWLLNQPV